MSNSKLQNPCQVAGALDGICYGGPAYELDPLVPGSEGYNPPSANDSRQYCDCNTVMFSLVSACTLCQNVPTMSWKTWANSCAEVHVAEYPGTIPPGFPVPKWAFLDYTVGGGFDAAAAMSAGGQPEKPTPFPTTVSLPNSSTSPDSATPGSTSPGFTGPGSPSPTSTGSTSVLTGGSQTKKPVSSVVSSPNDSTRSDSHSSISTSGFSVPTGDVQQNINQAGTSPPNVRAIVGGTVGGLAFLVMVGVGVWIPLRRRKPPGKQIGRDSPENLSCSDSFALYENNSKPSWSRLYDPSDPSASPSQSYLGTTGAFTILPNKLHYTGAAEL